MTALLDDLDELHRTLTRVAGGVAGAIARRRLDPTLFQTWRGELSSAERTLDRLRRQVEERRQEPWRTTE